MVASLKCAAGWLREALFSCQYRGGRWQCAPGTAGKIIRLDLTPSLAEIESTPDAYSRAEVKSAPRATMIAPK
jgi:hypothetical protein